MQVVMDPVFTCGLVRKKNSGGLHGLVLAIDLQHSQELSHSALTKNYQIASKRYQSVYKKLHHAP